MKKLLIILFCCFACAVQAQSKKVASEPIQLNASDMVWTEAPASLPKGSKVSILEGDPKLAGMFTMRVELPANVLLAAHTHPREERVTVLAGEITIGIGATEDNAKMKSFKAGSFYVNPPNVAHFLRTGPRGVLLQLSCMGPWELNYIEQKK